MVRLDSLRACVSASCLLLLLGATGRSTSLASSRAVVARDTAMFAGGCFWSMERPFQHVPGVLNTTSGYADAPFF
jgi:peptide-methionine (S)-S-oxide reductase